jgi:putative proteasome-type protease
MTFCVAMKVADGLVGLADTQVTAGTERITAPKVTVHQNGDHSMFIMSSGLRSVRDKALTYFEEVLEAEGESLDRLYKAVNAFAHQVRRVASEDGPALAESEIRFDFNALVGGQLAGDSEHRLYLLYPQGNWVEVTEGTPYFTIGESGYGKPLMDRALHYDSSMEDALKIGFLAFDATRTSATHVDFPVDVVLYRRGSLSMFTWRFERDSVLDVSDWWQDRLRQAIDDLPSNWVDYVFRRMDESNLVEMPSEGAQGGT